jgi:hypothetical protein
MSSLQSVLTRVDPARRSEFLHDWGRNRGVRHVVWDRRRYEAALCRLLESQERLRSGQRLLERARNRLAITDGLVRASKAALGR